MRETLSPPQVATDTSTFALLSCQLMFQLSHDPQKIGNYPYAEARALVLVAMKVEQWIFKRVFSFNITLGQLQQKVTESLVRQL